MLKANNHQKEFIFEEDRDFESCHASTLVCLKGGDVLAAWFGGSAEGNPDVAIWMARRGASGWGRPFVAASCWGVPLWNPVLFRSPDGRVLLFYKEGKTIAAWKTMVKTSTDNGLTFSEAAPLVLSAQRDSAFFDRGPVKNKCVLLSDGRIAAPGSTEPDGLEIWDSFVDISGDNGAVWEPGPFIPVRRVDVKKGGASPGRHGAYERKRCFGKGLIQPTLWESKPSRIHALMRSTSSAIFRSDSVDGGRSWCCAYNTGLPNNNSGIDLVKLSGGELLLVSNPVGHDWGVRTPLTVSLSLDNGETWKEIFVLEKENGEYSYPAIIAEGNDVFITYTWKRERIAFWHLEVSP